MRKYFLLGVLAGVAVSLLLTLILQAVGPASKGEVMAEAAGEKLTRRALRQMAGPELIPVENDRYRILRKAVDDWVRNKILEKEAKEKGVSREKLYQHEIWNRAQVSYDEIQEHYQKNRELYDAPLETVSPLIAKELRNKKYAQAKKEYLARLRKKYGVRVFLKKPKSYVPGLALPSARKAVTPETREPRAKTVPLSVPGHSPSRGGEAAPVTMTEFADFHCGFCKKVSATLEAVLKSYPEKVRLVFRHHPLSNTPGQGSYLTHEASVCAHEQGKFWEYHDGIFSLSGFPQEADLYTLAGKLGLDEKKFEDCLKNGRGRPPIEKDLQEGVERKIQGTPMIYINQAEVAGAYPLEHFKEVIEGVLNPEQPPKPQPSPQPEAAEKKAPVIFKDLKGRPTLGPRDAPVTLVEFSDFHCPFCQRVTPTLEQIMKNFPGKVKRVWRHYPLSFHAGADRTHEASECAHEQGKFWEYHDKLFLAPGQAGDDATRIRLAEEAGLDKKKFEKCLAGGKYKDLIQKEIKAGNEAGVRGTPAIFVNGSLVSGAQPYENFESAVRNELTRS